MAAVRQNETQRRGPGSWSQTRWLVVMAVVIAVVIAVVLLLMMTGGGSGMSGHGSNWG